MKNHLRNSFVTLAAFAFPILGSASDCESNGAVADLERIQAQRKAFNQAIVEKDDRAIGNILREDVILLTGTDSDLFADRNAQVAIWQEDFASEERAIYERTAQCVRVSGVAPVAMEYGVWRGQRVADEDSFAAGSYAAKWRKEDGEWRLEAELFSTETCAGDFCPGKATQN